MQKEHILKQISAGEENSFYGWQCLSISFQDRTLDLVVKDEANLYCLLALLQHILDRGHVKKAIKQGKFVEKLLPQTEVVIKCRENIKIAKYKRMKFQMKLAYIAAT